MVAKKRLKSSSKGGQSTKARSDESKGKKKARLAKDSRDDKAGFKKAPARVQKEIKARYARDKKKKTRIK